MRIRSSYSVKLSVGKAFEFKCPLSKYVLQPVDLILISACLPEVWTYKSGSGLLWHKNIRIILFMAFHERLCVCMWVSRWIIRWDMGVTYYHKLKHRDVPLLQPFFCQQLNSNRPSKNNVYYTTLRQLRRITKIDY